MHCRDAVIAVQAAQVGDDRVIRRCGDQVAIQHDLVATRGRGRHFRRRCRQLGHGGGRVAGRSGGLLHALLAGLALLLLLFHLGRRCGSGGFIGRLVADVFLLLRLADDAQGIDDKRQLHVYWQREVLQRRLGFGGRDLLARVLQRGGTHMHQAEAGGAIPQRRQVPLHIDRVQRYHHFATGMAGGFHTLTGPDQAFHMAAAAHRSAHAFGFQRHVLGQVAADDADHGRQRLVVGAPVPERGAANQQRDDQCQQAPGAPARATAGSAAQALAARQRDRRRGGRGVRRAAVGAGRICRCHQKLNPRFRCRRNCLASTP